METYRYDVRSRPNTREQQEGPSFRDMPAQLTLLLVHCPFDYLFVY